MSDLRVIEADHHAYRRACLKELSRRLRDHSQPITPEIRESLASIIDDFQRVYDGVWNISDIIRYRRGEERDHDPNDV
ncbi:MAG: hypothetical protein ACOY4D_03065 [Pseudomonadota bacterium]